MAAGFGRAFLQDGNQLITQFPPAIALIVDRVLHPLGIPLRKLCVGHTRRAGIAHLQEVHIHIVDVHGHPFQPNLQILIQLQELLLGPVDVSLGRAAQLQQERVDFLAGHRRIEVLDLRMHHGMGQGPSLRRVRIAATSQSLRFKRQTRIHSTQAQGQRRTGQRPLTDP
ncbi:hypothetical protein D3C73_583050 [compost metagenome]